MQTRDRGELRPEVMDSSGGSSISQPLIGDQPRGNFQWNRGSLESLKGKEISLRFVLRRASIFAYWLGE